MNCDDCLDKLYAFLDQELEPTDKTEVVKHLEDCAGCGDNLAFEERFLAVIRDCGTSDIAPAELRRRVADQLRRENPPTTV